MNNHSEIVSFIWSVADLIRDTFKRGKYQDVILPLTVLRRIDCVLAPTRERAWEINRKLEGKLENLDPQLRKASGYAFYNTSLYDFDKLLGDAPNLAANLRNYINGFSPNMREVLEKFDFDNTITKLDESGLLFLVLERFKNVDLHPSRVSNHDMGTIFEELVRKFNEALNENPGEHFTPREVIRLMADLLIVQDVEMLGEKHIVRTVYDPCCGSGGMLTIAKERIQRINSDADIFLYGQEVNPETWALCKADMLMTSPEGRDADHIAFGSTLSKDGHADRRFDYLLTNPPYGKDWSMDEAAVRREAEAYGGRFVSGLPRISDGQLLFLQHMLSRMHRPKDGGSRVAIVMNGSPLFTGDAGSGESEIRRWILDNDWLEAIVALPEQLFYNTGIATYVWVLSNRKEERRKGKVQLIDATSFWAPMRKSLGDKRREISPKDIERVSDIHRAFEEGEHCRIFNTTDFGYRKVTIERPLRLNFQASAERIERLRGERAFQSLAESKKKGAAKATEEEAGRRQQEQIIQMLRTLPDTLFKDRKGFEAALEEAIWTFDEGPGRAEAIQQPLPGVTAESPRLDIKAPLRKAILNALSERDETAPPCLDSRGHPEPDAELRDTENVPLGEDVTAYFEREVRPHVPDAWVNRDVKDHKDRQVGKVGYEINFNRYFYTYQPPRPLEEIEADIRVLEGEIMAMLHEMINGESGE